MEFKILTYNNGVGIVTDAMLLKELIYKNITEKVSIKFIDQDNIESSDIAIWIQNFDINLMNKFKKNIFFINEEWSGIFELSNLHLFDHVICKSKFSYNLIKNYCDVIHLPFISKNLYNINVKRTHSFLHFVGRSIQKNTELVLNQNVPITLLDPYNRYEPNSNFTHINTYQTNEQIINLLNSHNIHICCSLYESWGHYLFEGLSTGAEIICSDIPVFKENLDPDLVHFIPTKETIDLTYCYCNDNKNNLYPLRKSFFVDEHIFTNTLENFVAIGKNQERIKLFHEIMSKSRNKLINFFNSI